MARKFESELRSLLSQFGDFAEGIPNLEQQKTGILREGEARGVRAGATDLDRLQRLGFGRSVGAATVEGTRGAQANRDSMQQILQLITSSGQLQGQQKLALLRALAPIAQQRANRPSTLGRIAGFAGKTALSLFGPGLISKFGGSPLLELLKRQANTSRGFSNDLFSDTNSQLNALDIFSGRSTDGTFGDF